MMCFRLETVEQAELQYKKKEKKDTPFGWDVFNTKALYQAYLKRSEKVGVLSALLRGRRRSRFSQELEEFRLYLKIVVSPKWLISTQVPYTLEEYAAAKARDPDFDKAVDSLQYGKAPKIPEKNIDKMVAEITERCVP